MSLPWLVRIRRNIYSLYRLIKYTGLFENLINKLLGKKKTNSWNFVIDECQGGSTQQMENVRKCHLRDYLI